jgi:starch synthase
MFVAAEVAPFASAGGLGEVVGSLPKALADLGVEVSIFVPRYRSVPLTFPKIATLTLDFAGKAQEVSILQGFLLKSRVPVYFLDFPPYYDRPGIYGEGDPGLP